MDLKNLWRDPVWSKIIATAIVAACVAVYGLRASAAWHIGVLCVGILGVATLLYWSYRNPIVWKFDNFLAMVSSESRISFIGFQGDGTNRSRRGFNSVKGRLVSLIDNSVSGPMLFVIDGRSVSAEKTSGIPPRAKFRISIPLYDVDKGADAYLSEYEFRTRWSAFRFEIELDGKWYGRQFPVRKVSKCIESFRRVVQGSSRPQVSIKPLPRDVGDSSHNA